MVTNRAAPIDHRRRGPPEKVATAILWVAAVDVVVGLAYVRYHAASRAPVGVDFTYFLDAARNVAAGRSPYIGDKNYVYPPPMALLLAPFTHVNLEHLWKAWTALVVAAPIVGAAAFVFTRPGRPARWLRPVEFTVCGFTVLYAHYWPVGQNLHLGQSDTIVFAALMLSALAASRYRPQARGALIGVAGLVKVWPAATGLAVFQRGVQRRRQALLPLVATLLLAPLSALLFGWSGLVGFFKNVFDARQQPQLVSDSVWSAPTLLFSHSGLARPVLVSAALHLVVEASLAAWVLALLVTALQTPGVPTLCTWNVTFCIILLLPVSHRQYAIYVLPLLWWWATGALRPGPIDWREWTVIAVLALWWLNQTIAWPYNGSSPAISSIRYCIPFAADLIACTVSVIGARTVSRTTRPAGLSGPSRLGELL